MKLLISLSHWLKIGVVSSFAWLRHFQIHAHVLDSLFTLFFSYFYSSNLLFLCLFELFSNKAMLTVTTYTQGARMHTRTQTDTTRACGVWWQDFFVRKLGKRSDRESSLMIKWQLNVVVMLWVICSGWKLNRNKVDDRNNLQLFNKSFFFSGNRKKWVRKTRKRKWKSKTMGKVLCVGRREKFEKIKSNTDETELAMAASSKNESQMGYHG